MKIILELATGTEQDLVQYMAETCGESPDSGLGVVERLEANVEFLSLIVARLVQAQILGASFSKPAELENLIFGTRISSIQKVRYVAEVGDYDDIPF